MLIPFKGPDFDSGNPRLDFWLAVVYIVAVVGIFTYFIIRVTAL